jgi:hypothetical protein
MRMVGVADLGAATGGGPRDPAVYRGSASVCRDEPERDRRPCRRDRVLCQCDPHEPAHGAKVCDCAAGRKRSVAKGRDLPPGVVASVVAERGPTGVRRRRRPEVTVVQQPDVRVLLRLLECHLGCEWGTRRLDRERHIALHDGQTGRHVLRRECAVQSRSYPLVHVAIRTVVIRSSHRGGAKQEERKNGITAADQTLQR